jgi:hypothetical protein
VHVASTQTDELTVDEQRVRRLFRVLDDLARYASDNASASVLAHAWDPISELLLHADGSLVAAVREVPRHRVGSRGWWGAINRVRRLLDAANPGPRPAT